MSRDILDRAAAVYARHAEHAGVVCEQPSRHSEIDAEGNIVLHNRRGVIARLRHHQRSDRVVFVGFGEAEARERATEDACRELLELVK